MNFFILLAAISQIQVLLRFFRINDPYRLLGLFLIMGILCIPFFVDPPPLLQQELRNMLIGDAIHSGSLMYVEIFDSTPPITSIFFAITESLFEKSLSTYHILALIILFFQASFFAILLINNKAYTDSSYVPALVFGLLCFFSFDMLSLSAELLASTILLLSLNNIFKEIEFKIQRDEIIFNLGVYLGLTTLIVFSYIIFFFATVFILIVFTRMGIRKFLLLLLGFVLPHLLLWAFYFYKGEAIMLLQNFYAPNLTLSGKSLLTTKTLVYLAAIPISYFIFSLFMLNREARFTKYQSQLFQVMFLWMLFSLIHLFIARALTPHSFIIFIPTLAYFISHYLLLIRRKWIAETMLWLFIIGLLGVNFMSRYEKLTSINYAALFPVASKYAPEIKNKKVMMLADDMGIFNENQVAGNFLEWELAERVFKQSNFYENVILVAKTFQKSNPDVVIDPQDLMKNYFERIPELKDKYKKEGKIYWLQPSNN